MALSLPQGGSGYYRQKEKAKSYGKDLLINQVQELKSKWVWNVTFELTNTSQLT